MPTFTQNEKSMAENKRYTPRWSLEAHYVHRMNKEDMAYKGHVKDVSCLGACLTTDQCFAINQKINLTLLLPERGVVRVCGTVAWIKEVNSQNEIGIDFFNTSIETQETILQHAINTDKDSLTNHWFEGWEGR